MILVIYDKMINETNYIIWACICRHYIPWMQPESKPRNHIKIPEMCISSKKS
jgi:hypothetical protein